MINFYTFNRVCSRALSKVIITFSCTKKNIYIQSLCKGIDKSICHTGSLLSSAFGKIYSK